MSFPDVIRRWAGARGEQVKFRSMPLPVFRFVAAAASPPGRCSRSSIRWSGRSTSSTGAATPRKAAAWPGATSAPWPKPPAAADPVSGRPPLPRMHAGVPAARRGPSPAEQRIRITPHRSWSGGAGVAGVLAGICPGWPCLRNRRWQPAMAEDSPLGAYRAKRDPARTPEPMQTQRATAGRGMAVGRFSSFRSTTRGRCTGTSAWSTTASWRRGRCRRASRRTRRRTTWPFIPRTIRLSTGASRETSRKASTAAGT